MMVVVTGASGYIGGQVALCLKDAGHAVVGIDRRPCPEHLHSTFEKFHQVDIEDSLVRSLITSVQPTAIVHCAGTSLVGPSMTMPREYYHNNVVKTINMLDHVLTRSPQTRIIFSSSAATYGNPVITPCEEVDPCEPISPYGESKRMIEQVLESYHRAYGLNYVAFRYFNACGADSQGRHGQEPGATHIIARVLESIRDQQEFVLYGEDYDTLDGTCVRDYVHVEDIAQAHVMALNTNVESGIYNLGSNTGTSNKQIIKSSLDITQQPLTVVSGPQRVGDPPMLTASDAKFASTVGKWRNYTLDHMIQHAWAWYVR